MASPTIRAASAACGLSETQIYVRLRDAEFKERYNRARREVMEQATAALQGHLSNAITTLSEVCDNPEVAPQTRINAATAILTHALKLTEQMDVLTRMDELEETVRELEAKQ